MKSKILSALYEELIIDETQIGATIGDWILKKLPTFTKSTMIQIGNLDAYEIYSLPHEFDGQWIVFFHEDQPALISRILDETWRTKLYKRLQFVYIPAEYRSRELLARLMWFIKHQLQTPIICDSLISLPALKAISKVNSYKPNYFQIYWDNGERVIPYDFSEIDSYVGQLGGPDSTWRLIIENSVDARFTPLFDTVDSWPTQFYQIFESAVGTTRLTEWELFVAEFQDPERLGSDK